MKMHRPASHPAMALLVMALWPLAAVAQERTSCQPGERLEGDVGIQGLRCRNCTLRTGEGAGPIWRFRSEPEVLSVRPGSPAAGRIQPGDVITAIDDMLITTVEAGRRFANLPVGENVTLTIRRGERISRVRLAAESRCSEASPTPPDTKGPGVTPPRPPEPGAWFELQDVSVRPPRVPPDFWPSGWLGFGISCRCSIKSGESGEPIVWSFKESPEIYSVEPGSPAARAGLERGDILLKIDGLDLTGDEGGKRFGAIQTGETVYFEYRRGDERGVVSLKAESRPLATLPGPKQLSGEALRRALERNEQQLAAELELARLLSQRTPASDTVDVDSLLRDLQAESEIGYGRAAEMYAELLAQSLANAYRRAEEAGQQRYVPGYVPGMSLAPYLGAETVRFAGTVGNVAVEVRGGGSVLVTVLEDEEKIVITTGDARIVLKAEK